VGSESQIGTRSGLKREAGLGGGEKRRLEALRLGSGRAGATGVERVDVRGIGNGKSFLCIGL
jgi:hypothetical protein